MPTYCYRCEKCGQVLELHGSMSDEMPEMIACTEIVAGDRYCGGEAMRSFRDEQAPRNHAETQPGVSVNAGVGVDQVDEANRLFADLGVSFDRKGDMHYPNFGAYKKALKRRGLVFD